MSTDVVRAAGGVVVRNGGGGVRLVVVHRPEYDDWTLPKGKCVPGESLEECALREVEEETALRCHLLSSIGATRYVDRKGRPKEVSWWLMRPESGELKGQSEVDVARWASPDEAIGILSYERDRELLQPLLRETRIWMIRHADAGDRASWTESDRLRPLNEHGQQQAERLAQILSAAPVDRLVSSPYVRCMQTLVPLAANLGRSVEEVDELAEGHGLDGVEPLLISGGSIVACTHGDVMDELLGELRNERLASADAKSSKGSIWVLQSRAGLIQSAEYLPPLA